MPSRLKSLELQGYKTFATRTLFEFADKVTAIVGPNGSGKSNIADSLRWVLGEQSYSLLRAKKTEDMIFSGSEKRARAGMASASVVFDNSEGWLPIDFSEVSVSRRAYRDGQNEYLINGQRVRLRDVSELLAQSGLAERTYTIIGQGVVDAALALKAEERRRLFEEAAGISLHRSRREEALRRLEKTQRNLERVQDIMSELRPRLRSLERQARRAREYEQIRNDLQVLLREWYGYHWHRAQREMSQAREGALIEEKSLERARRKQREVDAQLASMRTRIQSLRGRLNSWHRQSAQLHTQREQLSRKRAVTDERIRSLHEQQDGLSSELLRLQEEVELNRQRVETASQEVARLESEMIEAQNQAESARAALQTRQTERSGLEQAVQDTRDELTRLIERQGRLGARLAEEDSRTARSRETLQEIEAALQSARDALDELREYLKGAESQRGLTEKALQEAEKSLASHRQRMARLEAQRKDRAQRLAGQEAEVARLQAQLDVLEQAEKSLEGYSRGAQVLLKAGLRGAEGVLSSRLEVPPDLERAIAAVLGEFVDAVLLEASANPEEALDMLVDQSTPGALLPLEAMSPPVESGFTPGGEGWSGLSEGILGLASDLVGAAPELRPAVDALLGDTLVVRDREAARRALSALPPSWALRRAVTLKGETFYRSGPVVAGQDGKSSALSRPRRRRELIQELDKASTRLLETQSALDELQDESQSMRERDAALQQAEADARRSLQAARDHHRDRLRQVETAEQELGWQETQRSRIQEGITQHENEKNDLQRQLAELDEDIAQAREALRQASHQLGQVTLDENRSQVTHWEAMTLVARRAMEAGKTRLEEQKTMLARAEAALEAARQRRAAIAQELDRMAEAREDQREQESQVTAQIESLQELIEPAETELEAAEVEQEALQDLENAARQTASSAEHQHAQARINLTRQQEALENLRRRIEDDFGLVAFDYEEDISGPTPLPLEGMVEQLPKVERLSADIDQDIKRQRSLMRRMGAINPEAQSEYESVRERFTFMSEQIQDLKAAEADIRKVIEELDELMERELRRTFDQVADEFSAIFRRLFGGGSARLLLTDPEDMTNTGIDIEARLPGRREQGLALLSGGERSLTATSLVFSLLRVSPTPFCVLDEVDAMLDEANVGRFRDLLRELSDNTQFLIVTHNRNTVQVADVIYGVTMGRDSASQVISLRLDEVSQVVK